jgi:uncharacterized protein (TIGR02246 family)
MVMRSIPVLAFVLASAPVPVAAQGGKDPGITKVADAYVKATLARDAKALAALYAEDAVDMPPNQPTVRGRADIEAHYQKLFTNPIMKLEGFTLTHSDTTAAGNVGYDVGMYSQTLTIEGKQVQDTGRYVVILRRSGGDWKIVYAIYNSDQPAMMRSLNPRL